MAAVIIAVAVVLTFMLSKPIGAYQLVKLMGTEYGCEHKNLPSDIDFIIQCSFCDSNRVCRSHLFCRYWWFHIW